MVGGSQPPSRLALINISWLYNANVTIVLNVKFLSLLVCLLVFLGLLLVQVGSLSPYRPRRTRCQLFMTVGTEDSVSQATVHISNFPSDMN